MPSLKELPLVLAFVLLTAICWGIYGPVLREGQAAMDNSHLRPFICVGIAYFVIAIVVPAALLALKGERGGWTFTGAGWSLAAGAAGALGALGIILAFHERGSPVFVMPLVFGGAPVVNTFLTMYFSRTYRQAGPMFYAGLILVIAGSVTVLLFKPAPAARHVGATDSRAEAASPPKTDQDRDQQPQQPAAASAGLSWSQMGLVTLFVLGTVVCWGAYGPVLHKGQLAMAGSRLRPFICVGIAYFLIAVLAPLGLLMSVGEAGGFSPKGIVWSLMGGAAGAVGALGIILAFNSGGKPVYVMPLVFGGAPVINTLVSMAGTDASQVSPLFYAGLIMVILGAATVLVFAPKPDHSAAHAGPAASPASPEPVEATTGAPPSDRTPRDRTEPHTA
jgi:drug/metabolite transporter (DMT)-like permease